MALDDVERRDRQIAKLQRKLDHYRETLRRVAAADDVLPGSTSLRILMKREPWLFETEKRRAT